MYFVGTGRYFNIICWIIILAAITKRAQIPFST